MSASPPSFDEELMTEWSMWVLDHGVPDLPEAVAAGDSIPVARWAGRRFGAVMHLQWCGGDPDTRYLGTETELFRRTSDGWTALSGGGGTNWPFDPPLVRPSMPASAAFLGGSTCSGDDDGLVCAHDGLVGIDGAEVVVADEDGRLERQPIDSPLGIVLVAVSGSERTTVTVLASSGEELMTVMLPVERA